MTITSFGRPSARYANLLHFVPALVLFVAAMFVQHPSVIVLLLLADALMVSAICRMGHVDRSVSFLRTFLRRGVPFLVLLAGYTALVAALTAYPLQWLLRERSLGATLAVSTEVVVAMLCLWRLWPCFGLPFVWRAIGQGRAAAPGVIETIRLCVMRAHQVSGQNELFFSHGLVVAFATLLLAAGTLAIGAISMMAAERTLAAALAIYAVIVPFAGVAIINRCARALLADCRRRRGESVVEAAVAPSEQPAAPAPPEAPAALSRPELNLRLLRCARAGQTDLALAALACGADPAAIPPADDRDQRSVIVLATLSNDLRLLRQLIVKGADLNREHAGLTPLIAATRDSHEGRPDAVMTLLTNGADPRCCDAAGNTPLHYAALSATPIVSALLCDASAMVDAVNRDGLTPLATACSAGNWTLARFLLERGARIEPERAQPTLLSAAASADDDPSGVELLLRRKGKADARDALGRTALMVAALHGNATIAEALIDAGAQAGLADSRGTTALMEAARAGAHAVLELILAHDPAIDAVDAMGRSALIIACQSRQADETTVQLLLRAGASADVAAGDGKRAVDFAAAAGRWNIVALLDPSYPLPANVADASAASAADPDSPQHLLDALRFGHWSIVDKFAQRARGWAEDELPRLFLELADHESSAPRTWLIDHGLEPLAMTPRGEELMTALLDRLPQSAAAAIEWQAAGAQPAGGNALARICDALAHAAEPQQTPLVGLALALLDRGAEAFAADGEGRTPLAAAVAAAAVPLAQALLERGADPNARDRQGRTPLFAALAAPFDRALVLTRLLIRAGANPEVAAINGETPLGLALARPEAELRRWLNWSQWKLPPRALRAGDLPAAAALGDIDAVNKLLELGLPIDAADAQGADALLRAAGCGHAALVARLLECGADPARSAPGGATPLSAAVTARRDVVVATLLERGVAADHRLSTGGTPLMIAAALGFPEIAARLLARGAQANAQDERGTRALHAAAQFAFRSGDTESARRLLQLLLEHGADVNATNAAGQTPLLLLLGARADPGSTVDQKHLVALLPLFLLAHADIDLQDQRGVGPLHACAMHGLLLPARALLAARADPARRDVLDRTPRQVAHLLGFVDVAAELGARESAEHALGGTG